MRFRLCARQFAWMMLWAAFPLSSALSAAPIDVSIAPTAFLGSGNTLRFGIPSWNYSRNAERYGLPLDPTDVGFVFVSAATDVPALFDASLQSADGSVSETFTPLTFSPGAYSSSNYSGAVSTLQASVHLSAALSQQIFGGSEAALILRNAGPAIILGLPSNTLQQDLLVTLGGGESSGGQGSGVQISVGALRGPVSLQESVAPEPDSAALLMVGGAFLGLLARFLSQTKLIPNQSFAIGLDSLILSMWQIGILPLKCRQSNQRSKRIN